ncbi:MAG: hypothetical protein PHQ53_10205 [Candidatus Krumholzibacteria bacterium]|nr:hypothetical protein [Candidatus Krumholzibacteria bacterium]
MRAIGHFFIFIGFFLVFASLLAMLLVGAMALRSTLALLMVLPVLFGIYLLYHRGYWAARQRATSRRSVPNNAG